MVSLTSVLLAAIVFHLKHLLADYVWVRGTLLRKDDCNNSRWLVPHYKHCLIHSVLTLIIVGAFTFNPLLAFSAAALDFAAHSLFDRIGAMSRHSVPDENGKHNYLRGCESFLNHMTYVVIIYLMFVI